jgi:hypothetical protein
VVELNRQPQSNDKYIAKDYSRNILPARCGLHVGHSLNPDRQPGTPRWIGQELAEVRECNWSIDDEYA